MFSPFFSVSCSFNCFFKQTYASPLGRVKLGIHKVSGEKVAIKIISKSHLAANASVEHAVKREIAVMKLIHHPNIMRLLDVIDLSDSPNLYVSCVSLSLCFILSLCNTP